ncbi:hypothetical protein SCOR_27280 [Sulfidibacter corallicola]
MLCSSSNCLIYCLILILLLSNSSWNVATSAHLENKEEKTLGIHYTGEHPDKCRCCRDSRKRKVRDAKRPSICGCFLSEDRISETDGSADDPDGNGGNHQG